MSVSIILVNYNTKDYTLQCIASIYKYTKNIDFEIIVVDNNSSDESVKAIANRYPEVIIIRNRINSGFGAANNIGILNSQKKYVFLLNTDTELISNALVEFWDYTENYRQQNSKLICIGGNIIYPDHSLQNSYGNFPTLKASIWNTFGLSKIKKTYYLNHLVNGKPCDFSKPKEVPHILGVAMFIDRAKIIEVGLFDEDFFLYFEETELCFRIRKKGYHIMLLPQVKIVHHLSKSTKSSLSKVIYTERSRILYFKKVKFRFIGLIRAVVFISLLRHALLNKDISYVKAIKEVL